MSEVAQLCPTLCDPMDYSLPGSSFHGIFQARVLEWVAISFSRESSRPSDRTQSYHLSHQGSPPAWQLVYNNHLRIGSCYLDPEDPKPFAQITEGCSSWSSPFLFAKSQFCIQTSFSYF